MVGSSIENYRIDEILGHGGMGVVYKAMDTSLDRTVALKVMNPSFAADEEFLWRFKSEAKVLGRLLHPNIVNVYAFRHIETHLFIVMEYVDGGTLSSFIDQQGLVPFQKALPILKQSLIALEMAHNANIIHRDIKPQNILLTKSGQVKISDFGLAKIQENTSTSVTRVGVTGGTIYYMPPEQSVALSDVDHRGDIYSLGMTMYQMLAGRMPFDEGSSTLTILKAIDEQKIPSPNTFNPHVPAGMAEIVMRAIKKDRAERFQSATEMRVAIEQFEASFQEEPASTGTRIYTPPQQTQLYSGDKSPNPKKQPLPKKAASQNGNTGKAFPFKKPAVLIAGALLAIALVSAVIFGLNTSSGDEPVENATAQVTDIPLPATTSADSVQSATNTTDVVPGGVNNESITSNDDAGSPTGQSIPGQTQPNQPAASRPTPPTTTASRSVLIESTPSNATIFLDGKEAGKTPRRLQNLSSRSYKLELRRNGFQNWEGVVNPGSQNNMSIALKALQGGIKVIVRPFGDILIDGASRAQNTNAAYETSLDAGTYTISAIHPALGKWDKRITVSAGATQDILFNFNREINVTIISDPVNAEIFIDGTSTSRYTPSQIKLRPGNHTISVRKEGFTLNAGAQDIVLENELSSPVAFKLDRNE